MFREEIKLRVKGLAVWALSTFTIISLIHLIDSTNALFFNNEVQLLQLYPLLNSILSQMSVQMYFYLSAGVTAILWGITCILAFDNPIETFLNNIITDAQQQRTEEPQVDENNGELFTLIYETMESDSKTLLQVKDLIRNVRAEVKDIVPIKESLEKTKRDLNKIRNQLITLEEKVLFPMLCQSCKNPIKTDFKLCPYCGIQIELPEIIISNKILQK
jgi:hypothetical protein